MPQKIAATAPEEEQSSPGTASAQTPESETDQTPQQEPDVEDVSEDPAAASTRGFCICSSATSGDLQSGSSTYLMFIDFPTPETDTIDVLAGQWARTADRRRAQF